MFYTQLKILVKAIKKWNKFGYPGLNDGANQWK